MNLQSNSQKMSFMFPNKARIVSLLEASIKEMELLQQMSAGINTPDDFISSISGLTVYRACGMSLQYITENFIKIRNIQGREFFIPYKEIPWEDVFGMRDFLSHEYGDSDPEGIFNTVKDDIPILLDVTRKILGVIEK